MSNRVSLKNLAAPNLQGSNEPGMTNVELALESADGLVW